MAAADRVRRSIKQAEANSVVYREMLERDLLYLAPGVLGLPGLTHAEMRSLYKNHFAKSGSPGRKEYEKLRDRNVDNVCSYCCRQSAMTLDHFVPQEIAPELSLEPWNLVPACRDCNTEQLAKYATGASDAFFHPHFVPDLGRWLFVDVEPVYPWKIELSARPAPTLPPQWESRIRNQFKVLGLSRTFRPLAARRLTETSANLKKGMYVDQDAVRAELDRMSSAAFACDANDIFGALHEALSQCSPYLSQFVRPPARPRN